MFGSFALPGAFFLSGAAGLIFQVVWLYRCGLVFGSSVAAVTVVLSAFMAGLAVGNALAARFAPRIHSSLAAYATLEAIVGASGVLTAFILPRVGVVLVPIAIALGGSGTSVDVARFALAFLLMLVPATAMGATLPVLVAAVCRRGSRFGIALGRLYGWNTLGAVSGVLLSEIVLIAPVGVGGSAIVAAVINMCAAALALAVGRGEDIALNRDSAAPTRSDATTVRRTTATIGRQPDAVLAREPAGAPTRGADAASAREASATRRSDRVRLLVATALSGALLLALEVVWFRFLTMYVLVTTLATSLMLAVVLAGIGVGGLVAAWWLARHVDERPELPVVACSSGVAVVACYALFQVATTGTQVGAWDTVLWFTCVLTLPASILSGVLFTLIGDALRQSEDDDAAAAGWLVLANTAGATLGPPLATYLLLPYAGLERSFFAIAVTYAAVAGLIAIARRPHRRASALPFANRPVIAAAAALAVALVLFPSGAMKSRYFARAAAAYADDGSEVVATREGPAETLFVMQQRWLGQPVYSRLITNGFSMSGTAMQGQRYMRAFAYYPMLLHDGPIRRALVICYGVGVTLGAVTQIPTVGAIDVAEISRDVVAMSDAIYPAGSRPLDDSRVRLHLEDGRFFLQTTSDRYDLITGEPPPPRTPGTVNIYTREYFQLVHDRLADGGFATYWVPVARPHPGTDVNGIIRAFCDVFADCSLWNATPFDLMLIGSRGASGPRSAAQFSTPWQTPGLEAHLRDVGFERPEQIGATFIGDGAFLREFTARSAPLTDDFPQRLRPVSADPSLSDPGYGSDPAVTRLYDDTLDPRRAKPSFLASPLVRSFWPADLIARSAPYFEIQRIINRVYWEGGRPLRQIADLDHVLSTTTLRTLPLWILGSDEVKQRIGESSTDAGAAAFSRALRALSGRDYAGAVQWLVASTQHGEQPATVRPLLAYALMKSGQTGAAREMTASARPATDDERHFWEWMSERLDAAAQ